MQKRSSRTCGARAPRRKQSRSTGTPCRTACSPVRPGIRRRGCPISSRRSPANCSPRICGSGTTTWSSSTRVTHAGDEKAEYRGAARGLTPRIPRVCLWGGPRRSFRSVAPGRWPTAAFSGATCPGQDRRSPVPGQDRRAPVPGPGRRVPLPGQDRFTWLRRAPGPGPPGDPRCPRSPRTGAPDPREPRTGCPRGNRGSCCGART